MSRNSSETIGRTATSLEPPAAITNGRPSGVELMKSRVLRVIQKTHVIGMLVLAVGSLATLLMIPNVGNAQDARVTKSMAALKDQTAKLGAPKIDGKDAVGGRDAPALYFGSTKMNNNFSVVDAVAEQGGRGMAATLFVKSGDQFIRVTTNVSTALYFGSTKMNNNFSVVDAVAEQGGRGMAATAGASLQNRTNDLSALERAMKS
jgi:hypothetical protein